MKRIVCAALMLGLLSGCAVQPAPTEQTVPTETVPTELITMPTAPMTVPTEPAVPTPEPTEPTIVPTELSTAPTEPVIIPTAPTIPPTEPTIPTEPGPSILSLLQTAVQPVGSTMYIWGGGWNEEDTGAGIEAVTLGLSSAWAAFASQQDATYDHEDHRYQIHDGLDCSGYVGWVVYNALETENGRPGYVCKATHMAQSLADRGFGEFIPAGKVTQWLPGDVMSMPGHVWLAVGTCDDSSVLFLHSSPPGVSFCGTLLPDGGRSQAVVLAEQIMAQRYPDWYARYPDCARTAAYLESSAAMRWSILSDDEGLRSKTVEQIVAEIFS